MAEPRGVPGVGTGMAWEDFTGTAVAAGDTTIFVRHGGSGTPVLLLHGFPETHQMWRDIAPALAAQHHVVCADLTRYGASGCPASGDDHARYAKRAIAADMVRMMAALGHERFAVVGHDRGGRVAYRLALDHPDSVTRAAVLDVIPVEEAWARADDRFALGYWPWFLLAQDAPLPEKVMAGAAEAIVDAALSGWGSAFDAFPHAVRDAYVAMLADPDHAHAIAEEYRAGATIDRDHDRADRTAKRRIACPLLALWSAAGPLGEWYRDEGGPLAIWRGWADRVEGVGVRGGHFFPKEHPAETATRLAAFLAV